MKGGPSVLDDGGLGCAADGVTRFLCTVFETKAEGIFCVL